MQDFILRSTSKAIFRNSQYFLLLLALALPGQQAFADRVPKLYESQVPVYSQTRDERNRAIRVAFEEILVRICGRSDVIGSKDYPGIQSAIKSATRYAQQFRFYNNPQAVNKQGPKLVLWVRFDEKAVNQVLRNNQLPVWGDTRPATLVWLAVEERGQRQLLSNDSKDEAAVALRKQAMLRGIPVRLPLLDLSDRSSLRVSDVWGNFTSNILQASRRYQAEAVLVGRVNKSYSGSWTSRWTLYADGRRYEWDASHQDIAEAIAPGIDQTASALAMRYAQLGLPGDDQVLVLVKNTRNITDYNRLMKYMQQISQVSKVTPREIKPDSVIFQLTTTGGRLGIARAISLGDLLVEEHVTSVPVAGSEPAGKVEQAELNIRDIVPDLTYRLVH